MRAAREEATEALAHLEEDTNAATAVHETGEATLQVTCHSGGSKAFGSRLACLGRMRWGSVW